jgi:hypothetical protein
MSQVVRTTLEKHGRSDPAEGLIHTNGKPWF